MISNGTHSNHCICLIKIIVNYLQVIEGVFSMKFVKFRVLRSRNDKNIMMAPPGLEPGILDMNQQRANQLSYSTERE